MRILFILLTITVLAVYPIQAKKQQQRVVREIHIKRQTPVDNTANQLQDQPVPEHKFKFRDVQQFSRELNEYDQCVSDCKRQREVGKMAEYVSQLRQELAIAEDVVAQNDAIQNEMTQQEQNRRQNQRVPNSQGVRSQDYSQPQRRNYDGSGYQRPPLNQNYQQPRRSAPYQTGGHPVTDDRNPQSSGFRAPVAEDRNPQASGYRAPVTEDRNPQSGGYRAPVTEDRNPQAGGYRAPVTEDRNPQNLRRNRELEEPFEENDRAHQQEQEPELSTKDKVIKTVGNVYETVKNKVTGGHREDDQDPHKQNY